MTTTSFIGLILASIGLIVFYIYQERKIALLKRSEKASDMLMVCYYLTLESLVKDIKNGKNYNNSLHYSQQMLDLYESKTMNAIFAQECREGDYGKHNKNI